MKKITLFIIMIFIFVMPSIGAETRDELYDFRGNAYHYKTAESFAGGSGTQDDPYIITSWEEFNLMGELGCGDKGVGKHFKLTCNLYRADGSIVWSPNHVTWQDVFNDVIGSESNPFQGIFDGGNYEIITVAITHIFDTVGGSGVVRNIHKGNIGIAGKNYGLIENCRINTNMRTEFGHNGGGIAGENYGTVRCCIVKGTRSTPADYNLVGTTGIGGICGFNNGGIIEECYAGIRIQGNSFSARAIGGIAGDNTGGIIRNCLSGDEIFGVVRNKGSEAGGIVGKLNYGTVENCISVVYPSGSYNLNGAVAGAAYGDSKIINCYYCGLEAGNSTIENAKYGFESREEFKDISLYSGLDFNNIWFMKDGEYPVLRCMYDYSDCIAHWARDIIQKLSDEGYVHGYDDGTFGPDDRITKAEFITMAVSAAEEDTDIPYTDVPEWARLNIVRAYESGYLENIALSDTELGANEPITRLEAAFIVGIQNPYTQEVNFTDADQIPQWALRGVGTAADRKYICGYEDGLFRPYNMLTRAEAAVIINNKMN